MSEELIAAAELGDEAKRFLESDLGKVMIGLAQQEVALAQEALETVDPKDEAAIRKLQMDAKFGRKFEQWLNDLLTDGEAALAAFAQERNSV